MMIRTIAPALLAGAIVGCSGSRPSHAGAGNVAAGKMETTVPGRSIDEVLAAHTDSLMAIPGVVGTAIGLCDGERCIKVLVADSNPTTREKIPARLEGYKVAVDVTGTIRPR